MTNIYNKKVISNNGTLIDNWYEEESLKNITGETRTIPGKHIKKQTIDNEFKYSKDALNRDNTKIRTMGVDTNKCFSNTNSTYGNFNDESSKFNMIGIKEKIFKDFFTSYLTNEKNRSKNNYSLNNNIRLDYTTVKDNFKQKEITGKVGSRHMLTQDNILIDQANIDRLFMAQHDMNKYERKISDEKAKEYFNEFVPYYRDKEITYWSQNMDKSNVYKSNSKGINAFGKTSGFTQSLSNTKSANQYQGNIDTSINKNESKSIHILNEDEDFINKMIEKNRQRIESLKDNILEKYFKVFKSKGWLSIRKYKQFLFNLSKRRSTIINKIDFKYYTVNFGIYLNDKEIDFIFNIYDFNKNSQIDYELMINEFLKVRLITLYCNNYYYYYILNYRLKIMINFY